MHIIQFLCFLRELAPLPWPSCGLMWVFYEDLQMLLYLSCINCFIYYRYDHSLLGLVLVQPRKARPDMTEKIVESNKQTLNAYNTIFRLPHFVFLRGLAPLPWPSCGLMWMFYEDLQMLLYFSCINCFILLQYDLSFSCLVLVQPRKARPDMTEKLVTGT